MGAGGGTGAGWAGAALATGCAAGDAAGGWGSALGWGAGAGAAAGGGGSAPSQPGAAVSGVQNPLRQHSPLALRHGVPSEDNQFWISLAGSGMATTSANARAVKALNI
jgi:hypothetical protein